MIDADSRRHLRDEIAARMRDDRALLDRLRQEIAPLRDRVRPIHPRTTTSISLVAADGGNTRLRFDPFLVQVVRIVDSSNNEYCLEAITPSTSVPALSAAQFEPDGRPRTALGAMMSYLGVARLDQLSRWIPGDQDVRPAKPSWVGVYRELVEWAILFSLIRTKDFGTDTLIVADGLLRSTIFAGDLFKRYLHGIREGIERHMQQSRRRIYLAGVAKHSKVLERYRLAMALEGVLATEYPAYVEIPYHIEQSAYVWSEYARGNERNIEEAVADTLAGGRMFFVKFGRGPRDPVWPVDIYLPQASEAPVVLGYLLSDALEGFPVPFYPRCLQKAHENAALVDFDLDMLQDDVFDGIRLALAGEAAALDVFRLQDGDPAQARYQ